MTEPRPDVEGRRVSVSSETVATLLARARSVVAAADAFAVVELLTGHEPRAAAAVYAELQRELYWERKDLASAVAVSLAGVHQTLSAGRRATDADDARRLLGSAKALAYNLASFTWIGWNEPAVRPTASEAAVGAAAARLNLRLADELKRPATARANALWMVGAHELAAGEHRAAVGRFEVARRLADGGGNVCLARMIEGYCRLADLLARPGDRTAADAFDGSVVGLMADGSDEGRGYAGQLEAARVVLATAPA